MKNAPLKLLAGAALALMLASTPTLASDNSSSDQKAAPLYPNATRKEPKSDLSSDKDAKSLNDGIAAFNAGDSDKATSILQPIIDGSKSKTAQAVATQVMANVHAKNQDVPGAIDLLKRSIDSNMLPNDSYYSAEYQLAKFYQINKQYQESLDTLQKWRDEGKSDSAESHAIEGEDNYNLKKYPEAIAAIKKAQSMTDKPDASWNDLLMMAYNDSGQKDEAAKIAAQQESAKPTDPQAFHNSLALQVQQGNYPAALQLMEKGKAAGLITSEDDYVTMAQLYANAAQQADDPKVDADKAVAVLKEGMSKGIVKETEQSYNTLGDAYMIGGDGDNALVAYKKGIPFAKDGESMVKAGVVLVSDSRYSEAKNMLQGGIDKGVKKPGAAYLLLASANRGLKDRAGTIAALQKAEQYPDSADKAKASLAKFQAGN